jgi:hypothetical protein
MPPAEVSSVPAPLPATPLLDAALKRAQAASADVADAPAPAPATLPALAQEEGPLFRPIGEREPGPRLIPGGFLNEALPRLPAADDRPRTDLKVEAAAALVPGRTDVPAPAPRPIDPERPVARTRPADLWRDGVDRLRTLAHECAAEAEGPAHDLWTLRARLLDGLHEPDGGEPSPAAGGPAALRRALLDALAATAGRDGLEEPERTSQLHAAVAALEEACPLEISDLQLCRKVRRFGDYDPLEAAGCRAGHAVILYCEMSGVRYEPVGPLQRCRLSARVELAAAGAADPVWKHDLGTVDDLCRRPRRDFYVNYRITLPPSLAPGSYELRLIQDDLVANQATTRTAALTIAP